MTRSLLFCRCNVKCWITVGLKSNDICQVPYVRLALCYCDLYLGADIIRRHSGCQFPAFLHLFSRLSASRFLCLHQDATLLTRAIWNHQLTLRRHLQLTFTGNSYTWHIFYLHACIRGLFFDDLPFACCLPTIFCRRLSHTLISWGHIKCLDTQEWIFPPLPSEMNHQHITERNIYDLYVSYCCTTVHIVVG